MGGPTLLAFGAYYAWKEGFAYVIQMDSPYMLKKQTLDALWFNQPAGALRRVGYFRSSGLWVNPLSTCGLPAIGRGLPPDAFSDKTTYAISAPDRNLDEKGIVAQVGIPITRYDVELGHDALHDDPKEERVRPQPVLGAVAPMAQFPWSRKFFAYHTSIAPLLLPWPIRVGPLGLQNFSDIWMGYLAKSILDKLGNTVLLGAPTVRCVLQYRKKFVAPHCTNEHAASFYLYEWIDRAMEYIEGATPLACMQSASPALSRTLSRLHVPIHWRTYMQTYLHSLDLWLTLFSASA